MLAQTLTITEVNKEIEQLERELKDQISANDALLSTLRKIKHQIDKTGKDINTIVEEDPHVLSNEASLRVPEVLDLSVKRRRLIDFYFCSQETTIAVLVFACNRVTIKRNLDQLLKYRPLHLEHNFPIIVSQDCGHEPTRKVIQSYGDKLKLITQPDQSDFPLQGKEKKFKGYYKIARHYGWALNKTFADYDTVIIVEDDLDISPDFFEYFRALYPILKADQTLWCVSAWNDNGKEALVANEPGKRPRFS